MRNWTIKELYEYKVYVNKQIKDVRRTMKWYHSKEVKWFNGQILKILYSESDKTKIEAQRRLNSKQS